MANAMFDSDAFFTVIRTIRNSLLFDEKWYKNEYGLQGKDAASHYYVIGGRQGMDPSPMFSTNDYLNTFPEVREKGLNPLVHFEMEGVKSQRYRNFIDMQALRDMHPELLTDMKDGLLRIRVTNACNAKCRYCGNRVYYGKEKNHAMDRDWLFTWCRPLYPQIRYLLLTGGDPYITPHSYEFMKFISEEFPHITIATESNGIAFDEKFRELAAKNLFNVHVSTNASNASIYAKSCWEGSGGEAVFGKFMGNIRAYIGLLEKRDQLCFAPDLSMVINHDNYFDVVDFAKGALALKATRIGYYFDYTENDMNAKYFSQPDFSRRALKHLMEMERVLSGRVMVAFRLWVPTKELEMMQPQVDAESDAELQERYADLLRLSEQRSIIGEHEARNRLRMGAGKQRLTFDEDYSSTIRTEWRQGRNICFAPWKELDLYPDGRLDFCGWYVPTQNLRQFVQDDWLDWNEVMNSYEYMRGRYKILREDYDECLACCPMNDAANPLVDVFKYSCPEMSRSARGE